MGAPCTFTTVPKSDAELYNKVCSYGGRTKHPLNEERIIDYGDYYIMLRDLANSVKPEGLISNTTCEIALRVLASEMVNQKKYVMPLCIAVSKITCPSSFYTGMFLFGDVLTVFVSNLLLFSFMAFFEMQTKLRSATCNLDRTVRKAFQCTPSHRLDHKDFVSPQSITKRLFFLFFINLVVTCFSLQVYLILILHSFIFCANADNVLRPTRSDT
jgi:hypothetical protein